MQRRQTLPRSRRLGTDELAIGRGDLERTTQLRARGVDGVREVDDLDADLRELALEAVALLGAAPVVTLEEVSEPDLPPHVVAVFVQAYTLGRVLDEIAESPVDNDEWVAFIDHMLSATL
jgi:hypothetical protein